MKTTVDALKALYVALGGDLDDDDYTGIADGAKVGEYSLIPDVIEAIAKLAGSAIELPTVTTSNNGQVLTVSSGKWAAADVPAELPTVSATDNGSVLKVIDGAWGVGTDLTE